MFIEKAAELLKQNYGVKTPRRSANKVKFILHTAEAKNVNTEPLKRLSDTNFISTISGLGIQLVSDDNRKEILKRAKKILDLLRNVALGVLGNSIDEKDLRGLLENMENVTTEDEKLQRIFDEIKLRAKVEIAKYSA